MPEKIINLIDHKSKRNKKLKASVINESNDVGKLYADDLTQEFNNILNEQRRKKKDERTKHNS